MRVRQSTLGTWQDCALKARFKHIDLLPGKTGSKQMFGTCVHAALAQYARTGDVQQAVKVFTDDWANATIDVWNRTNTFKGLSQRGVEIIKAQHERQQWQARKIVAVEHRFLVPFGEHELEGTVDLIELKKNHRGKEILRVVDHKTTSKMPTASELYLSVQGTVYVYATLQPEFWLGNGREFPGLPNGEWQFEMLSDVERRFIWNHLWTDKELDGGGRTKEDFERVYRQINEIEKAIEADIFVPTISHALCEYCDYAEDPCPVRVPTRDEITNQDSSWL